MKNILILFSLILLCNVCYANNTDTKKVDCNNLGNSAYGFIPTTIPPECLPKKEEPKEMSIIQQEQPQESNSKMKKVGKVLEFLLEP